MKITVITLLFFLTFPVSNAQLKELTGTWSVFEISNQSGQDSSKLTEDQFKSNGLVFDYFLMDDGKFKQTGNLADESNGAVTTQTGMWKTIDNKLIVTLDLEGRKLDVDYTWELKDKNLVLTRSWPGMKVTMVCRKKQ
jgi:hypothetical protein